MAVQYRLFQNNDTHSSRYQKWYGRAVMIDTVGTMELAERIQANCTVKRSDVVAVLTELVEVMKTELQSSKRVKLDGFGSFKLGLTTTPADTAKDFSVQKNVVGVKVNFQPITTIGPDGKRVKLFCSDCKVKEHGIYNDPDAEEEEETGDDGQ